MAVFHLACRFSFMRVVCVEERYIGQDTCADSILIPLDLREILGRRGNELLFVDIEHNSYVFLKCSCIELTTGPSTRGHNLQVKYSSEIFLPPMIPFGHRQ